jgi:hypothetical protein
VGILHFRENAMVDCFYSKFQNKKFFYCCNGKKLCARIEMCKVEDEGLGWNSE